MTASLRTESSGDALTFTVTGRLDASSTGGIWREAMGAIAAARPARLVVDATGVTYCDGAGIGFFVELQRRIQATELRGLSADARALLDPFRDGITGPAQTAASAGVTEEVGRASVSLWRDIIDQIAFIGELVVALGLAIRHPRQVRWRDALLTMETAGVNAIAIISLIGFLIGVILAFQAAVVLKPIGAEIFVAQSVGIALLRELGPLMAAIVLAGRSGAAFAAEIGTMKVNEEINALTTMGLSSVRFLVVPRVIASVVVTPLLTLYLELCGLIGGGLVFVSLGFPLVTYFNQLQQTLGTADFLSGIVKSFVFGILIAGVGCLRGLQTKTGASAVGLAATRAVVSGLVLIILTDGLFAIIYNALGI